MLTQWVFCPHAYGFESHWWLSRGWCRVRGKEGQSGREKEWCIAYGNRKQGCQWEILAPVSEAWIYFWTCFLSREMWAWEQAAVLQLPLPQGCTRSQPADLDPGDREQFCNPSRDTRCSLCRWIKSCARRVIIYVEMQGCDSRGNADTSKGCGIRSRPNLLHSRSNKALPNSHWWLPRNERFALL